MLSGICRFLGSLLLLDLTDTFIHYGLMIKTHQVSLHLFPAVFMIFLVLINLTEFDLCLPLGLDHEAQAIEPGSCTGGCKIAEASMSLSLVRVIFMNARMVVIYIFVIIVIIYLFL